MLFNGTGIGEVLSKTTREGSRCMLNVGIRDSYGVRDTPKTDIWICKLQFSNL